MSPSVPDTSKSKARWSDNKLVVGVLGGVISGAILLPVGVAVGSYWGSGRPTKPGETATLGHFTYRLSRWQCQRAHDEDDPSTKADESKRLLDHDNCDFRFTVHNNGHAAGSPEIETTLFVGDDRYSNDDLSPFTTSLFPGGQAVEHLGFVLPIGAVPTKLTLHPSYEGFWQSVNPLDRNSVTYDLR